jgi:hypothetical protein
MGNENFIFKQLIVFNIAIMKKNSCFLFAVVLVLAACNSANHATKSTVNSGGVDLSFIDPGRYDTTWWNRAPYRLVQTNLREIDATIDVDAYVQSMVDASANIVLINVSGVVANYPTKLPFQYKNPFMKGDLAGDLIKGLHAKGIKVIGRFDFSKINETSGVQYWLILYSRCFRFLEKIWFIRELQELASIQNYVTKLRLPVL